MYIEYRSSKLKKYCEDYNKARKEWGDGIAYKVMQRLGEIKAADCIRDLNHQPPTRCHKLAGDREGQYAVDLRYPFRLVFAPLNEKNEVTSVDDDPVEITGVKIMEVIDYHG